MYHTYHEYRDTCDTEICVDMMTIRVDMMTIQVDTETVIQKIQHDTGQKVVQKRKAIRTGKEGTPRWRTCARGAPRGRAR